MDGTKPTVLVVGAGFAGVAAAGALRECGVSDVTILEAQDRPGGRVMKVPVDDGFVETGAQFIHGEEGNALFGLASKYDMLLDQELYQTDRTSNSSAEDYSDNLFCTSRGEQVDRDRATRLLRVASEMLRDYANSLFSSDEDDGEGTGSEATFTDLMKMTHDKVMAADDSPREMKEALLRWMYQWEYTDNGAHLEELSLPAYGKYTYLPGFGLTLTTSGLQDVFTAFLNDSVPADSLLLNKPVKRIHWCSIANGFAAGHSGGSSSETLGHSQNLSAAVCSNGVSCLEEMDGFSCLDNTSAVTSNCAHRSQAERFEDKPVKVVCRDGEVIQADHVIVTSSVGYLKKQEASMFVPPLPKEHVKAIREMGFGDVAKVFLVWDTLDGVLSPDVNGVQFLWLENSPPQVSSSKTALRTKDGLNWYDNIQGFERIMSHKGALMTWLAGQEAEIMESLPEHEAKDVLFELLVRFTNNPNMPRPKRVVRSKWHSNPYVLGGYSYLAAGVDTASHALLAQPIPSPESPLICLAGEATSQRFYSTVHGAIESGRRAAGAILRHHGLAAKGESGSSRDKLKIMNDKHINFDFKQTALNDLSAA
ncbi:hypothetical protein BaRGS_00026707 [Batillaria attramentaria]|uniref:Amine oxidase domain-containing protein n=1 Tax=Batillaria attramentaria TaxID=370345 RepID=A0ABD0K3N9_9CAEN